MNNPQAALGADMIELFGLAGAPSEEQERFLDAASEVILAEVMKKIEAGLPEDKREEFFRLFEDSASDEEKTAFFKTYIPNFKDIFTEEIIRFKSEALKRAAGENRIDASAETK